MNIKRTISKAALICLSLIILTLETAWAEYDFKSVRCGDAVIHTYKMWAKGDCGITITKIVKNGTGPAEVGYSGGSCFYNPNYHLAAGESTLTAIYFVVDEDAPNGAILRSTAKYEMVLDNPDCNHSGGQSSSGFSRVICGDSKTEEKKSEKAFITDLNNKKWEVRAEAAKALGRMKSKEAVEPLIRLLKDEEYIIRFQVVWALGKIKPKEIDKLLTQALNDKDYGVRWVAKKTLEKIRK